MMKLMSKAVLAVSVVVLTAGNSQAQFRDLLNKTKSAATAVATGNTKGGGSLTESEIANGLKEALQVGAKSATGRVSAVNGFFANQAIKVLMPPEAKKVESALRAVGMGSYVDKAILSMNRAAEDASAKALPIFVDAIKGMTISDGVNILRGSNDAATQYLKGRTTSSLTTAFRPVIQQSLDKVNATAYWSEMATLYNKLPTTRQKLNTDLAAYVTERALNGVFVYIAEEEGKIRTNPAAQVTDLLKKVFGGKS
jgi:hypothetical protein